MVWKFAFEVGDIGWSQPPEAAVTKSEVSSTLFCLLQLSLARIRRSIPISSDSEIKEFLAKELINFAASASKPQSLLLRMFPRWFHFLQFCVDSLPQM